MGVMGVALRDSHGEMTHHGPMAATSNAMNVTAQDYGPSYFTWPHHQGVLNAHIAIMTVAWVLWLPIGTLRSC
jgi:hypothetical protein